MKRLVKIAVIDSGINPVHSHIQNVYGGISILVGSDGYLEYDDNYQDFLGHGTAVAAAILDEAPYCELYAIRIFHNELTTYPTVLCAAIKWAIEQGVDIINLSLGFSSTHEKLRQLCNRARQNGIFLVAAYDQQRGILYPAQYKESVIAVSAGPYRRGEYNYVGDNCYQASGHPRELIEKKEVYNLHGHSFAAARYSGILAKQLSNGEIS